MKFAMNHKWKFPHWLRAYLVGLTQFLIVVLMESVNMTILMSNQTVLEIVINFLALVVISEFDDFLFSTLRQDPFTKLVSDGEALLKYVDGREEQERAVSKLEDILLIQTTTSKVADA